MQMQKLRVDTTFLCSPPHNNTPPCVVGLRFDPNTTQHPLLSLSLSLSLSPSLYFSCLFPFFIHYISLHIISFIFAFFSLFFLVSSIANQASFPACSSSVPVVVPQQYPPTILSPFLFSPLKNLSFFFYFPSKLDFCLAFPSKFCFFCFF
ncbi:hypothetical protein RIF29_17905 [Crotalaria pallida]|uniref:Transmembrane protein n=1 Tax=Crotalaria pallida TaxID=3830 RepID=A0AAN9IFQ6_CROPI